MSYAGAGMGAGIGQAGAAFRQVLAQMLGARQEEEARNQEYGYRASRDAAADERARSEAASTADYREAQLAQGDRQIELAEQREGARQTEAQVGRMDSLRAQGVQPGWKNAFVSALPGGGAGMVPGEITMEYDAERDPAVLRTRAQEAARTQGNISELERRAELFPPQGREGTDPSGVDPVLRRQMMASAAQAIAQLSQPSPIGEAPDPANVAQQADDIARSAGFRDRFDLQQSIRALVGGAPDVATPDPTAPPGGRPVNPAAVSAFAGPSGAGAGAGATGMNLPAPQSPVQQLAFEERQAGKTAEQILNEARQEGVPESVLTELASYLGIGR